MLNTHIIGIDLAKHVFHLIGHDLSGRETFRKKLTRQKTLRIPEQSSHRFRNYPDTYSVLNRTLFPA